MSRSFSPSGSESGNGSAANPLPNLDRFAHVFSQVPVGVWGVDRDLRFVFTIGSVFEAPPVKARLRQGPTVYDFFQVTKASPAISGYFDALDGTASSYVINEGGHALLMHAAPWYDEQGGIIGVLGAAVDIAPHLKAERDKNHSQNVFRLFMDNTPGVAVMLDADDHVVWGNQTYLTELGLSRDDVIGRQAGELRGNGTAESSAATTRAALHSDRAVRVRQQLRRPDGTIRHLDGHKFAIPQPDGTVLVGAVFADITDQLEAQQAREHAQARFTSFMELLPAFAYTKDARLRFTWANSTALHTTDLTLCEIVGRTGAQTPLGCGTADDVEDALVIAEGKPRSYRLVTTRRDGSTGHAYGFRFPLTHGSDAVGALFLDVSDEVAALKRARERESRLAVLFDRSPTGIAITDLQGTLTEVNLAFAALLGTTPSALLGKTLTDLTPPAENECDSAGVHELRAGRRSQLRVDKHFLHQRTGTHVPVTVLMNLVRGPDNAPHALIAMAEHSPTPGPPAHTYNAEATLILRMVAEGASDAQIAKTLGMSESTLRQRLAVLKRRLHATSRAHLVGRAYQHHILTTSTIDDPAGPTR